LNGFIIDDDDAVLFALVGGTLGVLRADIDARRLGAVIAEPRQHAPLGSREHARLVVLNPGTDAAQRHLELGLARDRARLAA
jgi:hypothetical protein